MKRSPLVLLALSLLGGTAFAAGETMQFPASIGAVTFPHKVHQEMLKDCQKCHATPEGGKMADMGKEWAHKTCKGCHTEMKQGPVGCRDCHRK